MAAYTETKGLSDTRYEVQPDRVDRDPSEGVAYPLRPERAGCPLMVNIGRVRSVGVQSGEQRQFQECGQRALLRKVDRCTRLTGTLCVIDVEGGYSEKNRSRGVPQIRHMFADQPTKNLHNFRFPCRPSLR